MLNHDIRVLQSFKDAGGISQNPGHMYEVDINAKPEDFLPWDQPASQWPDAPLGAAQDIAAARGMKLGDVTGERFYKELTSNMQPYFGQLTDADARRASEALLAQGIPGIRYLDQGSRQPRYQVTSNRPDFPAPTFQTMADAQMRADYMRRRGYEPEIKELPGSSNYAIWTPEIVTILRRYGLLPPVAAAGGLLAGPGQGEAAQP
jgi:hypothetical protein